MNLPVVLTALLGLLATVTQAQSDTSWTCSGVYHPTVVVLSADLPAQDVVSPEIAHAARLCVYSPSPGLNLDGQLEELFVNLRGEPASPLLVVGSGASSTLALAYMQRYGQPHDHLMLLDPSKLPITLPEVGEVTVVNTAAPLKFHMLQTVTVGRLHASRGKAQAKDVYTAQDQPFQLATDLVLQQLRHWTH